MIKVYQHVRSNRTDWRRDRSKEYEDFYRQGIFIFLFSCKRHQVVVCNVHCAWHVTWRVHHLLLDQNTWYTRSENKSTQYGVLYFALSINLALLSVRRRTLRRSHLDARARHYSTTTRLFLSCLSKNSSRTGRKKEEEKKRPSSIANWYSFPEDPCIIALIIIDIIFPFPFGKILKISEIKSQIGKLSWGCNVIIL